MRESERKKFIKNIDTIIKYLDKVIMESSKQLELYKNSNPYFRAHFIDPYKERLSISEQCKDNLIFVSNILNTDVETIIINDPIQFNCSGQGELPPGKFRTEALNIKRSFIPLLSIEKFKINNRVDLFKDCIEKLNYVYSHISKIVK